MDKRYEIIDGIMCYAPSLAVHNYDFPAEGFKLLYDAEESNFWFISRNRVIQHLFKKYVGDNESIVLEVGCGTGYVLKGLQSKFSDYKLIGSEIHLEGIKFAEKRLPNVDFIQLDAKFMPFKQEFDAIGAFDVLEHIDEDQKVMSEVYNALKPDSHFIITVPQYQWMWSSADDIAYHKRRYSKKELKQKIKKAGFDVVYIGSFVFALFPFMCFSRMINKINRSRDSSKENFNSDLSELKLNPVLNTIFLGLMKVDEFLIKLGVSLPFGGSLLAVTKKNSNANSI